MGNLIECLSEGNLKEAKNIIDSKQFEIDITDDWGSTALHIAARKGYVDIVKMLLNFGFNLDKQDKIGHTALHNSASEGHTEIVRLLLGAKANPNIGNIYNGRALHFAAYIGDVKAVELLLNYGAEINATTEDGATALQNALDDNKCIEVIRLLKIRGGQIYEYTSYYEMVMHGIQDSKRSGKVHVEAQTPSVVPTNLSGLNIKEEPVRSIRGCNNATSQSPVSAF